MLESCIEIIYYLEAFKKLKNKFFVVDIMMKGWGEIFIINKLILPTSFSNALPNLHQLIRMV